MFPRWTDDPADDAERYYEYLEKRAHLRENDYEEGINEDEFISDRYGDCKLR